MDKGQGNKVKDKPVRQGLVCLGKGGVEGAGELGNTTISQRLDLGSWSFWQWKGP